MPPAAYYDVANRLTAQVNVGTNGGSAYTRPGSVPAASDTVLVTKYGHAGDAVQQVALTGGPEGWSASMPEQVPLPWRLSEKQNTELFTLSLWLGVRKRLRPPP